MADFKEIFEKTLENEGGYVLHEVPGDLGGMTYAGISRKNWPNWYGWELIDSGKPDEVVQLAVYSFYVESFWERLDGWSIDNERIAYSLYDFAVNVGVRTAVKKAQPVFDFLDCDGIVGEHTLKALNTVDQSWFLADFTLRKIDYYRSICNKNKSQSKFLLGWINRTMRVHDGQ